MGTRARSRKWFAGLMSVNELGGVVAYRVGLYALTLVSWCGSWT